MRIISEKSMDWNDRKITAFVAVTSNNNIILCAQVDSVGHILYGRLFAV